MNHTLSPRNGLWRWLLAVGWTALILVLLLQSSSQPVIGPAAPPGQPSLGREMLLTSGHIVGFSILTALWWWALSQNISARAALAAAVVLALLIGTGSEIAQAAVPDRSASWFDLMVNWGVTLATAWRLARIHPA
ncbi:MAG: VanZ family protein [Anaerolineae bacterium]|nr:VanZ family protein [Anaerolineae bacterium]